MRITIGGFGRAARRAALGLAAACAALAGPAGPAAAQESPVPERRAVYEPGIDLYGGDIRSVFDTALGTCEAVCLADPACRAFTYNTRARACFLKGAPERTEPYAAALSARIVETRAETRLRALRRAGELGFLGGDGIAAARAFAQGLGAGLALEAGSEGALGQLGRLAAQVSAGDAPEDWLALARAAATLRAENRLPTQGRGVDTRAAVNAALRAADTALAAEALGVLATALEADGRGRLAVPALVLAERLAPSRERAAALERVRALFGFRVVEHRVESDLAAPRLCVTFSETLAPMGVDYAPFVGLEGTALPVEAQDRELCVEGLAHGSRYRVTLREGLPSAEGERLARAVPLEVYVRDRSPSVRFTGRDHVLARGAGAALPIVTVNADEVALELFRIGDRGLLPAIRDGVFGRNLDGWASRRVSEQLGEAVWTGTGLVGGALNAEVTTLLPMAEALQGAAPGVYALTARLPGAAEDWEDRPTQWFVLTDLGIAAVSGPGGVEVSLRSLATARPREGVSVRLVARNNEVLATARSDAAGLVRLDPGLMRGRGGMQAELILAEDGAGDLAFLDLTDPALDLSDRGVEGRPAPPPIDVFLATERGAYRPGETVHATVLARDLRAAALEGLPLTAIVMRPDGVEHARLTLPDQGAGGRALSLPLARGAMRGAWMLRVHADPEAPALALQSFLVEDFEAERIEPELALAEGPLDPAALPPLEVTARYLWGTPAGGLAVEGTVATRPVREAPARPGWLFGLEEESAGSDLAVIGEGIVTDAEGRALVPLPLPDLPAASRPFSMTATVRLVDASGRPVERDLTRTLMPAGPVLGLRPLFDGEVEEGGTAEVEVAAFGPDLAPLAAPQRLGWTLSRVETRYQWYRLGGEWNWEPVTTRTRVATGETVTGPDPVRIAAPVGWGRYELRLAGLDGTDLAASLGFTAGWYAPPSAVEAPDRLAVGLDRPAYPVGGTARLRVTVPHAGELVVQALGDTVLEQRQLTVEPGETVVELPVSESWGVGAYVAATLLRPMDAGAGRNPARAMGIAWAGVEPGRRALAARFEGPGEVRPRGPLEAVLRVDGLAAGDTAYATIAAVDLGILNLTGHAAPDPQGHYFGQRRLGVEMRDLYGRLIDGLTGVPGQVRSGGDGGMARNDAPPPTQELVAFFSGPVEVGPDGTARARFDLPAFNGTVRLMAVVWSARGIGQASRDILVRDPVVMALSGPRFLAPGDGSRLLVELTHAMGPAGTAVVEAGAEGPLSLPGGALRQAVTLPQAGRAVVELPLAAGEVGDGRITVRLTTPGGEVLVTDYRLGVRANDPETARQTRLTLAPGGRLTLDAAAYAGLVPGTGRASLAVGPAARLDVPGLLAALDRYPYGCTEQLVSRALPLLYLGEIAAAMGLAGPDGTAGRIAGAVGGVLANQSSGGSFGIWRPGGGDLWLDAYATDFLARARAEGHAVPRLALDAAFENLRNRVSYYGEFEEGGEDLAYALAVLARAGQAAVGDLRYYADARADRFATALAQAQIGLALSYTGDQPRADAMFARAAARLERAGDRGWRPDFGSDLRDAAGVLALAAEARSAVVDRRALVARVAADPRPLSQRSTQENAWSLLAARALVAETAAAGLAVDGVPVSGPVLRLARAGDAPVTVTNGGTQAQDAVLTVFGVPAGPAAAGGSGYRLERRYYTPEGEPAEVAEVAQGARLVAVVTVIPEREARARLLVVDPLPAGFEIDNPNLIEGGSVASLGWLDLGEGADHAEFRTDRVVAAVERAGLSPFRLAYMVRAVSPGRFHHPAASVEDMYRPEFRAQTAAGRLTVAP